VAVLVLSAYQFIFFISDSLSALSRAKKKPVALVGCLSPTTVETRVTASKTDSTTIDHPRPKVALPASDDPALSDLGEVSTTGELGESVPKADAIKVSML
jgi:hypothetical protein